jgi:hypothetical protein
MYEGVACTAWNGSAVKEVTVFVHLKERKGVKLVLTNGEEVDFDGASAKVFVLRVPMGIGQHRVKLIIEGEGDRVHETWLTIYKCPRRVK